MLKDMQEVLERGFDVLNEVYFNNELTPIVITIMSSPRSNGHFTVQPVWRVEEGQRLHEINLSAEHLNRPIENLIASLLHEMIHYYCSIKGIKEISSHGRYHNKLFKEEAEKRGLIITYKKYIGYSVTQPSEDLIKVIEQYGIKKPIDINRSEFMELSLGTTPGTDANGSNSITITPPKKQSSTRKLQCPCCGNKCRVTKDINIVCGDCMIEFERYE
ncbi:SprT-like domain-containing protein [Konateibacter massiliensis]|uniref:SprT-like domain-containing protein n=1 Tax=Konateibacter massiliensis TaxID=2002841 RepID=UPI000C147B82|nr:SprT-like domain-containing protein [Konateibacter massiliensis]